MILALVITFLIFSIIIGDIIYLCIESKYKINVLDGENLDTLHKYQIDKLELKRYRVNVYLNGLRSVKARQNRKEIPLDAKEAVSTNIYNVIEDNLLIIGYGKKYTHEIYECPYSKDNKEFLSEKINKYNMKYLKCN